MLSFQLPVAGWVKLDIYDINGRKVGAVREPPLHDQWYSPGTHNIVFDASELPSGIYFARLTAGEFIRTQKLVLLK
jgi:hypothetical protein